MSEIYKEKWSTPYLDEHWDMYRISETLYYALEANVTLC